MHSFVLSSCDPFTVSRFAVRGTPPRPVACASRFCSWFLSYSERKAVMDPNLIWNDLCAALREQDCAGACDQAAALLFWLDAGG